MIEFIRTQLENQFLSGGMVLMLLGAALAMSRRIPAHIYNLLHRKLVTTVDVSDQDQAFFWIQEWLAQHEYSKKTRLLTITTQKGRYSANGIVETPNPPVYEEADKPEIFFSPAPGMHVLKFEGHWLLLIRSRREVSGTTGVQYWRDMFVIKTFSRDRDIFRRLVQESRAVAFPEKEQRVSVYAPNYGNWSITSSRPPRDPDSVILEGSLMEDILKDSEEFFSSGEWYRRRGIPYQRGYLLYGNPGNGKTSLVVALASKLKRDVYLAKITGIDDSQFRQLMTSVPCHSIVLLEDVDCFFEKQDKMDDGSHIWEGNKLTFSGFLNALDGIICSEGRLLIMTTNHPEKLDPAMIRSGRIDLKKELCNATRDQARRLFLRFFNDRGRAGEFAGALPEGALSMADLQGILLNNRNDPRKAVEDVRRPRVLLPREVA
jgi:chaperone BCS1